MRSIVRTSVLLMLFLTISPVVSARATSTLWNDSHGRWSISLPNTYLRTDEQYRIGTKRNEGFQASATFVSEHIGIVSVRYSLCCLRSDLAKLRQAAQEGFDKVQEVHPDARLGPGGIHQTTLVGKSALQYDYYFTDNDDIRLQGRDTLTFSGGLVYGIAFLTTEGMFNEMALNMAPIHDSFRFTTRNIVAGVFNDPLGRFTLSTPPFYDTIPNFVEAEKNDSLSTTTLSTNPTTNGDHDPIIIIQTFAADYTFDEIFKTYETAGLLNTIAVRKGVDLGQGGVRHIMLDGHPAGIFDYYEPSDEGIRLHVYQIFTVLSGVQFIIFFAMTDNDPANPVSPVDTVVASTRFQVVG